MLTVYSCIIFGHDLRLVVLAAAVCALASFAAITLLHHVRRSTKQMRNVWLGVSAIATGFGIWATHFIAMLAFTPGIPSAYNIALTVLSLVEAIMLTYAGLRIALAGFTGAPWVGGVVVGGGIAVMHYTGMAAFEIAGEILWDPVLVAASIALGGILGAVALDVGLRRSAMKWRTYGSLLLTAAICSHHFTAMGAASIIPDPTIEVPASALPTAWLAVAVALASFGILILTITGMALDIRDRRRTELEADRMRGLANAAVEGLILCDHETIVTINDNFAHLVGIHGRPNAPTLATYFPDATTRRKILSRCSHPIEGNLRHHSGETIPVELILRPVEFSGQPIWQSRYVTSDLLERRSSTSCSSRITIHSPSFPIAQVSARD